MNGKLSLNKMQEKGVRKMPKTYNPETGEFKSFDYDTEGRMEAEEYAEDTGAEIIPTYDAGGRVQSIEGYGHGGPVENMQEYKEGGKVTYLEVEPGKFEKQHHFSKQVELSRERDIKNQAKGIASGKYKNLDITNITKSVEAKEREAVRQHKVSKELDRIYEAKKLKEKAKAEAEKLKKKRKKKKKKKK